jgi:hypothetical protein
MNVELNIQHYRMELKWSNNSQPPLGTWLVCIFPMNGAGRWSGYFPTVAEAVTDCLKRNSLPVIEAQVDVQGDSSERRGV